MTIWRDAYHGLVDGFGAVGMAFGVPAGAFLWGLDWVLAHVTFGRVRLGRSNFKHTVLASALGWGSLLAIASPYVRTHFVASSVNEAARLVGAQAVAGQRIDADCGPVKTSSSGTSYQVASVNAAWGLQGVSTRMHSFFAGPVIAEPYEDVIVPAGACTNGVLTVPQSAGLVGSMPHVP